MIAKSRNKVLGRGWSGRVGVFEYAAGSVSKVV